MGKDYIKSISKDIDNFIQCKYDLPKNVEEFTDRIRMNYKKFSIIYTVVFIAVYFLTTFMNKEFYPVFLVSTLFGLVSVVIGELKVTVPIAYYTKTMPTLTKATIVSSLLTTAHSVFGHVTTADKIKSTTQ
ncbi:PRA1 family protein [Entamoeba marina]